MKTIYDDWSDKWTEVTKSYGERGSKQKQMPGGNRNYIKSDVYCSDDDIKEELDLLYDNNPPPS